MRLLQLAPWQMGLLVAFTAAAILILYLLKPPPRRVIVSSTLLWSRILRERRRRTEQWRWWLSLLLALTIGLAVALAMGRPELGPSGSDRRVVIVIDNSPTMASRTSDGRTRWDRALETARSLLEKSGRSNEFLVVDTAGKILSATFEDRRTASEKLESLGVTLGRAHAFPHLDFEGAEVHVISDGVLLDPADLPDEAQVHSVFESADNVAITRFSIRAVPGNPQAYQAFVEVTSVAREPKQVSLHLSVAGQTGLRKTLRLEPGESQVEVSDLSSFENGPVRVAITSAGDSLDVDNYAYGYLPSQRSRRVVLVSPGNPYLESYLRYDPGVELMELTPEDIEDRPAADVYVFDRCAPKERPGRPSLLVAPPPTSWLPVVEEVKGSKVRQWDRDHVVMQAVDLQDLVVERATRYDAGGARVLAGSPDRPWVLSGETPSRWLLLTFALEDTNLPFHAGLPIFLSNAAAWLAAESTALSSSVGTVWIPGMNVQIKSWEGEALPSSSFQGSTVFEADAPGLYVAVDGKRRFYVAANPEVSDINRTRLESKISAAGAERGWSAELWGPLLMLAFVLLLVEWWTYHHRWTV